MEWRQFLDATETSRRVTRFGKTVERDVEALAKWNIE